MTLAGIASLFVAQDYLDAEDFGGAGGPAAIHTGAGKGDEMA